MSRIAIVSAMHQELRALLPAPRQTRAPPSPAAPSIGTMEASRSDDPVGIGRSRPPPPPRCCCRRSTCSASFHRRGRRPGHRRARRRRGGGARAAAARHGRPPLFPRYEVPLTGCARASRPTFDAQQYWPRRAALPGSTRRAHRRDAHLADFGIDSPLPHQGLVVSGDRFVATAGESDAPRAALPDALAVEMEGAALAQVCPISSGPSR